MNDPSTFVDVMSGDPSIAAQDVAANVDSTKNENASVSVILNIMFEVAF